MKSDVLCSSLLERYLFSGAEGPFVPDGVLYAVLLTAEPDSGVQPVQHEVSTTVNDTAYVKQPVSFGDIVDQPYAENTNVVSFPPVIYGTGAAPYTVTHLAITNGAGVWLYAEALESPFTLEDGDTLAFDIKGIKVTETEGKSLDLTMSYLRWTLRNDTSGIDANHFPLYLALLTSADSEVDVNTNDSSYIRQAFIPVPLGGDSWTYNYEDISFPAATLVGDSATNGSYVVTHSALYDSKEGGNLLYTAEIWDALSIVVTEGYVVFASAADTGFWIGDY